MLSNTRLDKTGICVCPVQIHIVRHEYFRDKMYPVRMPLFTIHSAYKVVRQSFSCQGSEALFTLYYARTIRTCTSKFYY